MANVFTRVTEMLNETIQAGCREKGREERTRGLRESRGINSLKASVRSEDRFSGR